MYTVLTLPAAMPGPECVNSSFSEDILSGCVRLILSSESHNGPVRTFGRQGFVDQGSNNVDFTLSV